MANYVAIYWTGHSWKLLSAASFDTVAAAQLFADMRANGAPTHIIHRSFVQHISDFEPPVNGKLVDFSSEDMFERI